MKTLLIAALAAGAAIAAASPAAAIQGCGAGFHRGPHGHCRPNRGRPVVVAPGAPVVGVYYARRGWWDGRVYRPHRYRWHGGWRYR